MIFPYVSEEDLANVNVAFVDIDDTLYAYQPCHEIALQSCYEYSQSLGMSLPHDKFITAYEAARKHVTKALEPQGACRSRLLAFQYMFEGLDISSAYNLAYQFDNCYWDNFVAHMTVDDGALAFLRLCQRLGIKVCAVTDMLAKTQIEKLNQLGVVDLVQYMVTSEEAGAEKPSPQIFKRALSKMNVSPQNAIMIGDNMDKDIKGAQAQGIKAYRVQVSDDE